MNNVSNAHVLRSQMIHTLVPHVSPDTEALVMAWLIASHDVVKRALNCIDQPRLKFVPAGPLSRNDWREEGNSALSAAQLESRGYLFLDCGGGRFDQHVLPDSVAENKTASLHLLLEDLYGALELDSSYCVVGPGSSHFPGCGCEMVPVRRSPLTMEEQKELRRLLKIMNDVFLVICKNDLTGEDIAPKSLDAKTDESTPSQDGDDLVDSMVQDMEAAAAPASGPVTNVDPTPHTPRQLRNMILGWNSLYPRNPEKVYALASVAFGSIEQNVRMLYENDDAEELDVRKLFRLEEILLGTEAHFAATLPSAVVNDAGRIEAEARKFAAQAEKALGEMERQWHVAIGDYFRHATGRQVEMLPQVDGKKSRRVTVVFGCSESQRFGAVARRGNTEPGTWAKVEGQGKKKAWQVTGTRPEPRQPRRAKADVVIQMYGRGLFVISSVNGIRLDRVAAALREADLLRQEVEITDKVKAQLATPGNFAYRNRRGRMVEAIYFTNYRGAVGNYFRANPYSKACSLTEREICDIVVATLGTHFTVDTGEVIRNM